MTKKQFFIEFRKSFGLFLALTIVRIAICIFSINSNSEFVYSFLRPMYTMISWVIMLIYIIVDLYHELYFGSNKLILMLPRKTSFLWFVKYFSYALHILIFCIVGFLYEFISDKGLYNLQIQYSNAGAISGSIYFLGSSIISMLCGLSLLFMAIAVSRFFRHKVLSYISTAFVFLGVTITWIVFILNTTGALTDDCLWAMGIASNVHVYNQFAGIIPVMIIPKKESFDISETISIYNLLTNTVGFVLNLMLIYFFSNLIKSDYIDK